MYDAENGKYTEYVVVVATSVNYVLFPGADNSCKNAAKNESKVVTTAQNQRKH